MVLLLAALVGLHDGVLGKLVKHAGHLVPDPVISALLTVIDDVSRSNTRHLVCVVGLHQDHLLHFAPLDLLLVGIANPLVDHLELRLLLPRHLLLLFLAYLSLHSLLALLLQVLLDDLIYTRRV